MISEPPDANAPPVSPLVAPASPAAAISALTPLSEEADECAAANQEAWTTFADDNEPEDLSGTRSLASAEDDPTGTTSTPSKRLTDLEKRKSGVSSSRSEGREVGPSEEVVGKPSAAQQQAAALQHDPCLGRGTKAEGRCRVWLDCGGGGCCGAALRIDQTSSREGACAAAEQQSAAHA